MKLANAADATAPFAYMKTKWMIMMDVYKSLFYGFQFGLFR